MNRAGPGPVVRAAACLTVVALAGCSGASGTGAAVPPAAAPPSAAPGSGPRSVSAAGPGSGPGSAVAVVGSDVAVVGSDVACTPSAAQVPPGALVLRLDNRGSTVGGVRVLAPDGVVEAELTYVQPETSAEVRLDLPAGTYALECTPGMVGRVIRAELAVGSTSGLDPRLVTAVAAYRQWVTAQARDSLTRTRALTAAITAGDLAGARRLYPASRLGWERIEPVAEAFGDIDPKIDARLADLEAGQPWTGWHVIERGLFEAGTTAGLGVVSARLERDLADLIARLPAAPVSVSSMAAGALTLLDEVSRTKVTGEEEIFSRTDLVDFQANVVGARQVVALFRPVLAERDAALLALVDARFAEVQALLDALRTGPGDTAFVRYDTVGTARRRALSDAVDAAAEPVSRLAGALTTPTPR